MIAMSDPSPGCDPGAAGPPPPDGTVTQILQRLASGRREDVDRLLATVYDELRDLARRHLRHERPDHTLQPTALVHEAFMRLLDQRSVEWRDRVHFFGVASSLIRRVLVDHARARLRAKRGGGRRRLEIDVAEGVTPAADVLDLVALDDALNRLAGIDARQASIVEMRYFGGMTIEEVATALDMGKRSVDREWQCARLWLYAALSDDGPRRAEAT